MIFVTAVGLGPFPGALAILVHNVGVMGKLWAESIEATDYGPVDAMRVGGASRTQVVSHAVVPGRHAAVRRPAAAPFDVNVRSSLVLGLVGAGGISFLINESIKLFRFDEMLTYILLVLALVVIVDKRQRADPKADPVSWRAPSVAARRGASRLRNTVGGGACFPHS